jgi:hypothetical protein
MLHICWDIDDVLNDLTKEWFNDYCKKNEKFNHIIIKEKYQDLIQNPPHKILKINKLFYLNSLDYYRYNLYTYLKPNQKILDWFKKNGHKAHFSVLTMTPGGYADIVAKWLFSYFGLWIRSFNFIPSEREGKQEPIYDGTKANWNIRNKTDIFIDDSEKNIYETKSRCPKVKTILYKQPWNNGIEVEKVLQILDEEIEKHKKA